MKKILFLAILAGAAWWYFIGGRSLSDETVREFYQQTQTAMLQHAAEPLCAALAEGFEAESIITLGSLARSEKLNRQESCERYQEMFRNLRKLGSEVRFEYSYTIHSIELSPDKKTASVNVSYAMGHSGTTVESHPKVTATLIRKNGKVLLTRSEERKESQ